MRIILLFFLLFSVIVLSGCSLFGSSADSGLGVMKSLDQGLSWSFENNVEGGQTIDGVEVYSIAVNQNNSNKLIIGTKSSGIFYSENGGAIWKHIDLGANNIYDVAIDPRNTNNFYAVGVDKSTERGRIYKSEHEGEEWREIYTEPASGTSITSIKIDPYDSNIIYAGTINGAVIKSSDFGESWKNIVSIGDAIVDIVFDSSDTKTIYFASKGSRLYKTRDGGDTVTQVGKEGEGRISFKFNTLTVDPKKSGIVYAGSDEGIYKSVDYGKSWEALNIIESSEKYPIRAIAVSPFNSDIIIYSSARAIYRSLDGGKTWTTKTLRANGSVRKIIFDPIDENTLYLTLYNAQSKQGLLITI